MKMRLITCVAVLVSAMMVGCASTTVTPTPHMAKSSSASQMHVYSNESEVKRPFAVVGTIHHLDPGKYQRVDLNDVMPILMDKAQALKANAIIIDTQSTVISGIFSRGIEVRARAITY